MAGPAVRAAARRADAPEYRAYPARVVRVVRLSPSFVRITFEGAALAEFGYAGYDQRVKILLPQPGRTLTDLPTGHDWYLRWRQLSDDIRPTMRTYTVRAHRRSQAEMDVDFVLHGEHGDRPGPLSTWAVAAQAGDEVALLGPDRPGAGRMWGAEWSPPANATKFLLAGDETAVPAIAAILEALPPHLPGRVLAEVPEPGDVLGFEASDRVDVHWCVRRQPRARHRRGALLEEAVAHALGEPRRARDSEWDPPATDEGEAAVLWDVPEHDPGVPADLYVWMAGEAAVMQRLRRLARRDHALPKASVACMGYWREGRSEPL